jgi:hypothetical protein
VQQHIGRESTRDEERELSQPIAAQPGDYIVISIPEEAEEDEAWQEISRKHFLEAYDDQDAIYDQL